MPARAVPAERYLKTLTDYRHDPLPGALMTMARDEFEKAFTSSDEGGLAREMLADYAVRFVYHGRSIVGVVVVFSLDPAYAWVLDEMDEVADAAFTDGYTVADIDGVKTFAAKKNGQSAIMWAQNGMLVVVAGRDADALQGYAASVISANVDLIAPHVAILAPEANAAGWSRAESIAVRIDAADDASGTGVRQIRYRATGAHSEDGVLGPSATLILHNEGITDLEIEAEDFAGNIEPPQHIAVRIDRSPPTITFSGAKEHYAIYESVAIGCVAADEVSGIEAPCDGTTATVLSDGLGTHTVERSVSDRAGNTVTRTLTYSIDITPDVFAVGGATLLLLGGSILMATRIRRRRPAVATAPATT